MANEFTIIVQGPANERSLNRLLEYKKYGDVIVSCWINDTLPNESVLKDVTLIKSAIPTIPVANPQNIYLQSTTVDAGLRLCKTPYFIKVRSDEYYSNLNPIIEKVLSSPDKYICNNIWFKKLNKEWLHPGDHLIAGSVARFRQTFDDVMNICRRVGPVNNVLSCLQYGFQNNWWPYLSVETVLFLSFLKTHYGDLLENKIREAYYNNRLRNLMEENCDFVPIETLGEYVWSYVNLQNKREYLTSSDTLYCWDSPSIKTFEEI